MLVKLLAKLIIRQEWSSLSMYDLQHQLGKLAINKHHRYHRFSETNGALSYNSSDRLLDFDGLPLEECLLLETRDLETMLHQALS